MAATIVDLIEAVVVRLNAASFTESFTAVKDMLPIQPLEDLDALAVKVAPGPETWEKADRAGSYTVSYDVFVIVQAPISTETELDDLTLTTDEIKTDLATQRMANLPLVAIEQDQPFDAELAYNSNVFFAAMTFRYRGFK